MRSYKIYNWIVLLYFVLMIIFILPGRIAFGHGMGDLLYLLITACTVVIQLTVTGVLYSRQNKTGTATGFLICGTLFLLIAILLTSKFTYGRGPELPWDGHIFI